MQRGNFTMRPLGRVHSRLKGPDDDLSLHVLKFQVGGEREGRWATSVSRWCGRWGGTAVQER